MAVRGLQVRQELAEVFQAPFINDAVETLVAMQTRVSTIRGTQQTVEVQKVPFTDEAVHNPEKIAEIQSQQIDGAELAKGLMVGGSTRKLQSKQQQPARQVVQREGKGEKGKGKREKGKGKREKGKGKREKGKGKREKGKGKREKEKDEEREECEEGGGKEGGKKEWRRGGARKGE